MGFRSIAQMVCFDQAALPWRRKEVGPGTPSALSGCAIAPIPTLRFTCSRTTRKAAKRGTEVALDPCLCPLSSVSGPPRSLRRGATGGCPGMGGGARVPYRTRVQRRCERAGHAAAARVFEALSLGGRAVLGRFAAVRSFDAPGPRAGRGAAPGFVSPNRAAAQALSKRFARPLTPRSIAIPATVSTAITSAAAARNDGGVRSRMRSPNQMTYGWWIK